MINNREELDILRQTLSKQFEAQKKQIIICAGAGCVSKGAIKVYDHLLTSVPIKV